MSQNKKGVEKIVLTGGHAGSTAYAVVCELKKDKTIDWQIHWIGTAIAVEGKISPTYEKEVLPQVGVRFHHIITGRLQRKFTPWTIPSLLKIPLGFFQSLLLLIKLRPKIILSFGGFAAFPVVVSAWVLRIPVIIHEQTAISGLTNRLSARFAKHIALARKGSLAYFPKEKCQLTGNPLAPEIKKIKSKTSLQNPPVLLITAGSRGAVKINDLVDKILEKLLCDFSIIHQTGANQYQKFKNRKGRLEDIHKKRYQVYGFVKPWEWYELWNMADIIISRAGANAVSEIIFSKRPSILIPLTINDEQQKNAEFAKDFGIARVLKQKNTSADDLLKEIHKLKKDWNKIVDRVKNKKSPDINGAKNLVDLIKKELL
ncbi:UDP-N-acetylglucosamine--N-acetylmuramyl-(pentapeptide) pyrophosphoryl-undecaprenol N-acetylglucosamine transferase [Patescibacteria group bacterium]|nr:UDP-N-acetylglucosamine--N-acetylmuramyl-(pentapeptide) pyrophosphoryl-undecaprenol N-acetylglucosamine transferase [Patescibacteria group bacterium]